jgi:hypothetical protein
MADVVEDHFFLGDFVHDQILSIFGATRENQHATLRRALGHTQPNRIVLDEDPIGHFAALQPNSRALSTAPRNTSKFARSATFPFCR